ncbi:uncharacterized protein DEA37_0003302, partial [Paragonimus westermani]
LNHSPCRTRIYVRSATNLVLCIYSALLALQTLTYLSLIWLRQYPNVSFEGLANTHAQGVQPGKRFAVTATKWAIFKEFPSTVCTAAFPTSLSKAVVQITVNGISLNTPIDTESSDSYICSDIAYKLCWHIYPSSAAISLASTTYTSENQGHCLVNVDYRGNRYSSVNLSLLPNLCSDVLLGHDFLEQHQHILIFFGGSKPPFSLCSLTAAYVEPPTLFGNLSPLCKPIVTKSRRLNSPDQKFVESERALVLVTSNVNHKKRMVVDFSQTVYRFTYLDAYPLTRIDELVEKISHYEIYTTLDLQSAHHQVPFREDEKLNTAFEACGNLYQFCRIPFGVKNGVAYFQRLINNIITTANVKDTFAYVDNVTICGEDKSGHNINYGKFLNAAKEYGLTFNEDKTTIAAHTITLLGFQITHGVIEPDPERFRASRELPPSFDVKSRQRNVGMFAFYSNGISHLSDKVHNLIHNKIFPLPDRVKQTFEDLKRELENAAVVIVLNKLLKTSSQYAYVRLPNGKEETVSVKHLAPREEPDDLGTSECLDDANDLIDVTEVAHEMYSNDEAADSPTPTNYALLKQKQQRLHPYNLRSREA